MSTKKYIPQTDIELACCEDTQVNLIISITGALVLVSGLIISLF